MAYRGFDIGQLSSHAKDFIDTLQSVDNSKNDYQVFNDFLEMSAIAIQNASLRMLLKGDSEEWQKNEARYMDIVKRYSKEQSIKIAKLLSIVTLALEEKHQDFLGTLYQQLSQNKALGQYFTPYSICQLTAEMTLNNVEETLKENPFITINEPACGCGAMIIGAIEYLKNKNTRPEQVHFIVQDISSYALYGAFIQLSLLGASVHAILGDTLKLEERMRFISPVAAMNGNI